MTQAINSLQLPPPFPDHKQLPESDGTFVKNFQEHPQSILLTDSLGLILQKIHPDGQYAIGQDCGIYWRETDPPERGAEAPDWFYIPNVPPLLDGEIRRSYVIWREFISPLIVLEFASGDGKEERDRTPLSRTEKGKKPGKFWVYEQIIHAAYYGIFVIKTGQLEAYHLVNGLYQPLTPNERGHYFIDALEIEIGVWQGNYQNQHQRWLRWWDNEGNLILTGSERAEIEAARAEQEHERAEQEHERAEQEHERAEALERNQIEAISKLKQLGLTNEQIAEALNFPIETIRE